MNANAVAAFRWLELGVSPIPVIPKSKNPAVEWRQWQERIPPKKVVNYWFSKPDTNLGVICGGPTNLAIIDFDDIEYYYEWRKKVIKRNDVWSEIAGKTYRVRTARGMHLYVHTANRERSRKDKPNLVDIRCSSNYTLVPPSIHPSGIPYEAMGSVENIIRVDTLSDMWPLQVSQIETATNNEVDIFNPHFASESIKELKQRIPILHFVSQFSQPHRTSVDGRWWMARCIHPMHNDKTPSFQIDTVANRAKCLSSRCELCTDRGLDVIDLYAIINHLEIRDAIRELRNFY